MTGLKVYLTNQWYLCLFLLIVKGAKAGTFKDLYTCYVTHVCDCGLLDHYNECFVKAPVHFRQLGTELFRDSFPGNFTVADGLYPFTEAMCKDRENEKLKSVLEMKNSTPIVAFYGSYTNNGKNKDCNVWITIQFFNVVKITEKEMKDYERKMLLRPVMTVDVIKIQAARACVSPLVARCIEYGNACR